MNQQLTYVIIIVFAGCVWGDLKINHSVYLGGRAGEKRKVANLAPKDNLFYPPRGVTMAKKFGPIGDYFTTVANQV